MYMSTNYLAPAITILGLLICFLSTYFRKICSAVIGFVWGTIISAIVLLVMSILGMLALAETDLLIFAIIIGVICAVIFYLFEKIAAIINSFCAIGVSENAVMIAAPINTAPNICFLNPIHASCRIYYTHWNPCA